MSAPGNKRRTSTRDDWETPAHVFEALNSEFQFTLDVCASRENRKASQFMAGPHKETAETATALDACCCGLCLPWLGNVCFMNPPYSQALDWVRKAVDAANKGATVVALLPNNTDTKWFQQCWVTADEIRFVAGRIQFEPKGRSGNTGGSIIVVWWPRRTWRAGHPPRCTMWYQG